MTAFELGTKVSFWHPHIAAEDRELWTGPVNGAPATDPDTGLVWVPVWVAQRSTTFYVPTTNMEGLKPGGV